MKPATATYNVFFLNHDYFAQDDFPSFDDALAHAKKCGFDAAIVKPYITGKPHKGYEHVATWSILGGLHDRRGG